MLELLGGPPASLAHRPVKLGDDALNRASVAQEIGLRTAGLVDHDQRLRDVAEEAELMVLEL